MFGEVLIIVANGFSHKSPFNMSINIQTFIGTIPSTHFSTANAVLFVKIKGILRFISFPIVKTQGIYSIPYSINSPLLPITIAYSVLPNPYH